MAIAGPVRPTGSYTFEVTGAGTGLTFALHAELGGIKKLLMSGAVQKTMDAEVGATERSHGSLWMNRALLAAGLVDRVQVAIFPVVTGKTGTRPIFEGAADFDLELVESRTLDGHTQELT